MQYGYIRVSSTSQNINRQLEEMREFGIVDENLYIDKQSGKDFNRTNYQLLKNKIEKNDLVVVKSIDRLGRNYDMIIQEWAFITKVVGADIFVLDMPLLDTRTTETNLVGKFISDIVLQILSFVAENERANIKQRQAEGIKVAKEKGVHLGRPARLLPKNFRVILSRYKRKKITCEEAINILKINRSSFYYYAKQYEESQQKNKMA